MNQGTYDDGCGAEHSGRRADKAVFLCRAAKILDVGEYPSLHTQLHCAGKHGRGDLAEEHRAVRNLHIVTELEIAGEL